MLEGIIGTGERPGLPRQLLEEVLEPEMAKQYRLRRGSQCRYMPVIAGERWLCSCGEENPAGTVCACGLEPEPLTRQVLEELSREAAVRLEQEAQEAARQEAERLARAETERKAKRKKRILRALIGSASAVAALALAVGIFWLTTRVWIPAAHYRSAVEALEQGDLQQARREFTLAGSYRDAEDCLARFYTPVLQLRTSYDEVMYLTENTYDAQGNQLESVQTEYEWFAGKPVRQGQYTAKTLYSDQGLPMYVEDMYGTTTYSYNRHGDVVEVEHAREDGTMDYSRFFAYEYDDAGRVTRCGEICSRYISVNYSYEMTTGYTYDEAGRVLTRNIQANFPAAVENNYISETVNTYDASGRLIRSRETVTSPFDAGGNRSILEEWSYDEAGRQTAYRQQEEYVTDTLNNTFQTVTTVYNRRGDVTEHREEYRFPEYPALDYFVSETREYNREGKLTKSVYDRSYTDPERQNFSGYTETVNCTYDLLGRLVEEERIYEREDRKQSSTTTTTYTYGADGMLKSSRIVSKPHDPEGEGYEEVVAYDENGLQREQRVTTAGRVVVNEYTYAWFYYPEGTQKPDGGLQTGYLYFYG